MDEISLEHISDDKLLTINATFEADGVLVAGNRSGHPDYWYPEDDTRQLTCIKMQIDGEGLEVEIDELIQRIKEMEKEAFEIMFGDKL